MVTLLPPGKGMPLEGGGGCLWKRRFWSWPWGGGGGWYKAGNEGYLSLPLNKRLLLSLLPVTPNRSSCLSPGTVTTVESDSDSDAEPAST